MNELLRKAALSIQGQFNDFDTAIKGTDDKLVDHDYRPIFIVGAPRTGSTLLYQYLLQNLELSYISNIMALMPCHMIKMCKLMPRIARHYSGAIHPGYHGYVPGLMAPSEAGKIVDKWFDDRHWSVDRRKIRQSLAAISQSTGLPFLLKSLTNSTRIERLNATFPAARYIVTSRDERFAAQSIILAKRRLHIPADSWWSVQPPGTEKLTGKSEAYRAVWQVLATTRTINEALAKTSAEICHVNYEEFCRDPKQLVMNLSQKFALTTTSSLNEINTRFTPMTEIKVDSRTWDEIEVSVEQLTSELKQTS